MKYAAVVLMTASMLVGFGAAPAAALPCWDGIKDVCTPAPTAPEPKPKPTKSLPITGLPIVDILLIGN